MEVINVSYPHQFRRDQIEETIAAIGFFDGVHKGHQKVIQTAVQTAKRENKQSAVITFHPHPSVVLNQTEEVVQYITPISEKSDQLKKLQVDKMYIVEFNKTLSELLPEQFVEHFIIQLNVSHVIAGFDFTFGYKGAGNMNNIETYANGYFTTEVIDKVAIDNEKVSSTRIRNYLSEGSIVEVNKLLNRPFSVKGKVIKGDQRGRTIGFPTANLQIDENVLLPKLGVYAVYIEIDGQLYQGAANLGLVPTFKLNETKPTLEVYIFDFDEMIYGKEVKVFFYNFVRHEQKFSSIEQLVAQLTNDEKTIREYFTKE